MSFLLATKIHAPPTPPKRVARARLVRRLNEGLAAGRQITLVSAPAGFGKTTCASEWIRTLDRPIAWLSLDEADDDPGRFFAYLLAALQTVDPAIGSEIEPILRAGQLPPADVLCAALINDILRVDCPFLLVLDDVQVLQNAITLQVLARLVTNLPPPLHLVLLTREDPALPLARLRANNLLTEVRADDLRFSPPEAGDFIQNVLGLTLAPHDLATLAERTEGWIAGLQLAGLSVRDRPDPSAFIANLSGSHRYILSYLTEEVLNRQSADVQRFLLQTSILDRLSGELCNAVTGRDDCQALLVELFNANLFLVPLDDEQHWFRYHHLFADLLRDLQAARPQGETAALHQRASGWHARAGMVSEAIHHALAAADYPAAVRLFEEHAVELLAQWQVRTVEEWMQAIPPEWSAQSPRANLAFAWTHLIRWDFAQAMPYIQRLQVLFESSAAAQADPVVRAEWLALQAILLNAQGSPAESIELANQALALVPDGNANVRSEIYLSLTSAYQQLDDYPRAVQAFQQMIQRDRSAGNLVPELVGIAGLTLMALNHGQYHFGYEVVTQGIERVERSGTLPPVATALYGSLGQIYFQWRQLEAAHRCFDRAVQVAALSGLSDAELFHGVIRSRLLLMEGDAPAAAAEIHRTLERMRAEAPAVVGGEVIAQLVRVELAQGQLAAAETAFTLLPPKGEDPSFVSQGRFTLPDLPPHEKINYPLCVLYLSALRIALHRAQGAQASSDPAALAHAVTLASKLIAAAGRHGLMPIVLETRLLRAQMHAALGDEAARLADVAAALELGEPEGLVAYFTTEGPPVAQDLSTLLAQNRLAPAQADFARQILAAISAPPRPAPPAAPARFAGPPPAGQGDLVEPLTERELDVLRLMAEGLTYAEITGRLYISVNTVRTHVKAVYGKLGVN
ncbi:MAG TPA: LuxR C-terminal-related transcriptional regulator, partial [Anaerolineaceae bacterium]|nr:LuxR C-terminal-related transcriptional regulator [Anaerolineaceae bacterium]